MIGSLGDSSSIGIRVHLNSFAANVLKWRVPGVSVGAMGNAGYQDQVSPREDAEDQAVDTEANAEVVVAAAEGLRQGKGVFLHRLQCVQDLVAQIRWELTERSTGGGQNFNGPV